MWVLPSGTVTLLFTDIEGSTRLWEDHRQAMRKALERHDELVRAAIAGAGGYVFKTVGDAFCAAFTSSRDALSAAAAAQRALASESWPEQSRIRARMALHTGECIERDGDFFGPVVNRTARLVATAHGGQTVLSVATAELVKDSLPAGLWLTDLGEHRLKDLTRSLRIYQMNVDGLATSFPPIRSLDNPRPEHNLPVQVTTFVGRDNELAEVTTLLDNSRIVTLTGAGGCGKSRLAVQVAGEALGGHGNGAWLVELAPLRDAGLIAGTVASVLGVREEPGRSLSDTLADALSDWDALLVLDNCEHLLDECAGFAHTLLQSCRNLSLLATSRQPLAIPGEHVYRVPSLLCPPAYQTQSAAEAWESDAVRLFSDRAFAHQPEFVLDDTNAPAVASICGRLDGMPLAIELATARLTSMSLSDIEQRLGDRFLLLTGGVRTALPRQQTLTASIDWSYDLLTRTEQAVLVRLSVFAGGWTLEAAERVCALGDFRPWEVLDLLSSLVDKSLVQAELVNGSMRYKLLETIRQYSVSKISQNTDVDESSTRTAHAHVYLDLAREASLHLAGPDQAPWFDRLEVEHDNLRAGFAHFLSDRESVDEAIRLGLALGDFWFCGYLREGAEALEIALDRLEDGRPSQLRATAGISAAYLRFEQGEYREAQTQFEHVARIARSIGDAADASQAMGGLGLLALRQGDMDRALQMAEEGIGLAKGTDEPYVLAEAFNHRAAVRSALGDPGAQADAQAALALFRSEGNRFGITRTLQNLALLELKRGHPRAARAHIEECLHLRRAMHGMGEFHASLFHLGLIELLEGDAASAQETFVETLTVAHRIGTRPFVAFALLGLGFCTGMSGEEARAVIFHGAADALFEDLGETLDSDLEGYRKSEHRRLRRKMGTTAFDTAYQTGRTLRQHDVISLALPQSLADADQ